MPVKEPSPTSPKTTIYLVFFIPITLAISLALIYFPVWLVEYISKIYDIDKFGCQVGIGFAYVFAFLNAFDRAFK